MLQWNVKEPILQLSSSFFFLSEVFCPLDFSGVPFQVDGAFSALVGAEPQQCSIVLYVHHACALWKIVSTK
jgi:hypothetical protein